MQGATHRAGGVTAALTGFMYAQSTGATVEVSSLASLMVIYPFALWGSTCSDLDHHPGSVWDEVKLAGKRSGHTIPSQDPVSRGISHILHLTRGPRKYTSKKSTAHKVLGVLDCKHRSWQTHSELPIILLLFAMWHLRQLTATDPSAMIFYLAAMGITLGILSHLILDLLTPEGLKFAAGMFINNFVLRHKVLPERIKIIPHVPPKKVNGKSVGPGFFSTGGTWEKKIVFNFLHTANLLLLGTIIYIELLNDYTLFNI